MRPHRWTFLSAPDLGGDSSHGWSAHLIGVCLVCGLVRVMVITAHHDHRFDLSGDCRTESERAETRRQTGSQGQP